jgi:hypothetical protein
VTPSQAALDFLAEVQSATNNYYKNYWHLTRALNKHGYTWDLLHDPDKRNEALSVASDHARQRKAEKETA